MKTLNIEEFASSKESKFQAAYGNVMPECDGVTSTFLVDRPFPSINRSIGCLF